MQKWVSLAVGFVAELYGAVVYHTGDELWVEHSLRVARCFDPEREPECFVAGLLHDVVEDRICTPERICQHMVSVLGVDRDRVVAVMDIVGALTRRDGEGYMGYIRRLGDNYLAVRVKIADINDNLYGRPTKPGHDLAIRYHRALKYLES